MALPVRRRSGEPEQPGQRRWPWDPFNELENLWGEMGRLLDWVPSPGSRGGWMPLAEQQETDEAYVVRVELPGIPQEKIAVEVDEDQLTVSGEIDERQHDENRLSHRTGRFEYRTDLPRGVDAEAVTADLKEGILTVRVPKTVQAKRRRVEISGSARHEGNGTQSTQQ